MKTIKDYPDYKVGMDGSVYSFKHNKKRLLKPQMVCQSTKKYLAVGLYNDKNKINSKGKLTPTMKYLHRLVWETYVGEIPAGLQIDHIDENPHNCNLNNLRLLTHQQNSSSYFRNRMGYIHYEKRDEIIQDYLKIKNYSKLAEKWNCSKSTIYRVIKNKRNANVNGKTILVDGWQNIDDFFTKKDMRCNSSKQELVNNIKEK